MLFFCNFNNSINACSGLLINFQFGPGLLSRHITILGFSGEPQVQVGAQKMPQGRSSTSSTAIGLGHSKLFNSNWAQKYKF